MSVSRVSPYYIDDAVTLYHGDALAVLRTLPDESVDCCVTSPPYYALRDYGEPGQYGLERSPAEYVEKLRAVFGEVRRVLADDGTLWLDLGDTYDAGGNYTRTNPGTIKDGHGQAWNNSAGRTGGWLGAKQLMGMPWRVAFALQDDGWVLRSEVIWHKPNAMPESVTDRPSCTHEHVFLLAKQPRYWFDLDAIREPLLHPDALDGTRVFGGKAAGEGGVGATYRRRGGDRSVYGQTRGKTGGPDDTPPGASPQTNRGATGERHTQTHERGRNPGNVWTIPTSPFSAAHFAVMAPELARRCVVAGCKPGGVVLDPFCGVGTTGMVAQANGRGFVGVDLSATTLDLALRTRLGQGALIDQRRGGE